MYLASAVFAALNLHWAISSDYKAWGEMAAIAYGAAALTALGFAGYRAARENPVLVRRVRRALVALLVIGAVLVPLGAEIHWRADADARRPRPTRGRRHRAGGRPGRAEQEPVPGGIPATVGVSPSSDAHGTDSSAFFPYLPGMIPFGLMNALRLPTALTDARVALVSFTLLIAALALVGLGIGASRRSRRSRRPDARSSCPPARCRW